MWYVVVAVAWRMQGGAGHEGLRATEKAGSSASQCHGLVLCIASLCMWLIE